MLTRKQYELLRFINERLKEAGVPTTYRHFPGQFHGFFTMGKLLQQANIAVSEIAGWMKALK